MHANHTHHNGQAQPGIIALQGKLATAQMAISGIGKDGRSNGFDYVSTHHMVRECRKVLDASGLTLTLVGKQYEPLDADAIKACATNFLVTGTLRTYWALTDGSAVHHMQADVPVVINKLRPADVAIGVATSYALKSLLRDLLMLPLGDDPEAADGDDAGADDEPAQPEMVEIPKADRLRMTPEQQEATAKAYPDWMAPRSIVEAIRSKLDKAEAAAAAEEDAKRASDEHDAEEAADAAASPAGNGSNGSRKAAGKTKSKATKSQSAVESQPLPA